MTCDNKNRHINIIILSYSIKHFLPNLSQKRLIFACFLSELCVHHILYSFADIWSALKSSWMNCFTIFIYLFICKASMLYFCCISYIISPNFLVIKINTIRTLYKTNLLRDIKRFYSIFKYIFLISRNSKFIKVSSYILFFISCILSHPLLYLYLINTENFFSKDFVKEYNMSKYIALQFKWIYVLYYWEMLSDLTDFLKFMQIFWSEEKIYYFNVFILNGKFFSQR